MAELIIGAIIGVIFTEGFNLFKNSLKKGKLKKQQFIDLLDKWYEELGRVFHKEISSNYDGEYVRSELDLLEKKCRETMFYIKKIEPNADLFREINDIWHNKLRQIIENLKPENNKHVSLKTEEEKLSYNSIETLIKNFKGKL